MINFSIIIPTKNIPTLLDRCIASIPDRDDVQVIVVDDNSSADIVNFDHYPGVHHDNVTMSRTYDGRGAGYARNVGLSQAKGKWLLFADSDDFFVPDFYNIVQKHLDDVADMVLFKALSVDSDTLLPANRNENINSRIDDFVAGKLTAKEASIAVQSPWCRLIRREFVEANSIRFDEVMASNDTMFTTQCTCLANCIVIDSATLYVCTYRKDSLWTSRKMNPQNFLTRVDVQIRRNRYVKQYGFPQILMLGYALQGAKISIGTFLKTVWLIVKRGALFQGFIDYVKSKIL